MLKVSMLELYQIAEDFLCENFGMSLEIPIRVSPSMKSSFGIFECSPRKNGIQIKLSKEMLIHHDREVSIDVLKHELVHYALCSKKEPFDDGHPHFEATLKRLNVSSTRTYQYKGRCHKYQCEEGCQTFTRASKGYEKKYICGKCKSKFIYLGEVVAS